MKDICIGLSKSLKYRSYDQTTKSISRQYFTLFIANISVLSCFFTLFFIYKVDFFSFFRFFYFCDSQKMLICPYSRIFLLLSNFFQKKVSCAETPSIQRISIEPLPKSIRIRCCNHPRIVKGSLRMKQPNLAACSWRFVQTTA